MTPSSFVKNLAQLTFANVFNPYSDICPINDLPNAAAARRKNLRAYLSAAIDLRVDTIWMGRDLGYRGGRRTGLALTDEYHLSELASMFPGAEFSQATRGQAVAERTAAEIWALLRLLPLPPLLWNVFPFHPHEQGNPLTNRKFTSNELRQVDDLNRTLVTWLKIRRVVAIGQDATQYASRLGVEVVSVRHPSYGGISDFRNGIRTAYNIPEKATAEQERLF